jgi:hypothetical protein
MTPNVDRLPAVLSFNSSNSQDPSIARRSMRHGPHDLALALLRQVSFHTNHREGSD